MAPTLPARTDELPDNLRINFAQIDLMRIAADAAEQADVHQYATEVAAEVVRTMAQLEIPNAKELVEIQKQYAAVELEEFLKTIGGLGDVARRMAAPTDNDHEGASERDVSRDVLKRLHPDRAAAVPAETVVDTGETEDSGSDDEEKFKAFTEAKQNADEVLTQNLYARSIAEHALASEGLTAAYLERTRYKAWRALQAGQGRFESREAVDAWKEREIKIAPFKIRANLVESVMGLFLKSLGATPDAPAAVPRECGSNMDEMIKRARQLREKVSEDGADPEEFAKLDLESFDELLAQALSGLHVAFLDKSTTDSMWFQGRVDRTNRFADRLASLARALTPRRPDEILGELALGGLRGMPALRPSNPDPYESKPDLSSIISTPNRRYEY